MVEASGGNIARVAKELKLHDSSLGTGFAKPRRRRPALPQLRSAPRSGSCAVSSTG